MPEQRFEIWTGQWQQVEGVRDAGMTVLKHGRPGEATSTTPSSAQLRIGNRDGRYSPRNPRSDLFGLIGRNTPLRASVRGPAPYLLVPDADDPRAATPGTGLDITADLDVRVELALDRLPAQWGDDPAAGSTAWSGAVQEVISRWGATPTRGWRVLLSQTGFPALDWSTTGADFVERAATDSVPYTPGQRFALRVVLDVNNGAAGHTVTFYTAPSLSGPWTELGDPVVTAGTTTIAQLATHPLEIGSFTATGTLAAAGRYYAAELRDGVDGTVLASPDFTTAGPGDPSLTDAQGNVWTLSGGAEITDYYRRGVLEIPSWPQRWDTSGNEVGVPLKAAGILRRLGQGVKPLQSTLRRRIPSTGVLAYWPCEDGETATTAASGLATGGPAAAVSGLDMAANSDLPSSAALPQVGADGGSFLAPLPTLTDTSLGWRAEMVYYLDELPATSMGWFRVRVTGGGAARITGYIGGGEVRMRIHDPDGAVIGEAFWTDAGALAVAAGGWCRVRIIAEPDGAGWDYRVRWTTIGLDETWSIGATLSGALSQPTAIDCVWPAGMSGLPIGHITYVGDPDLDVYGAGSGGPDDAFAGERALIRMRRLAQEEALPLSALGASSLSPQMGPQGQATLLELLRECAAADGGILGERRDALGLQYQARHLRYNQPPALELDYAAGHIAPPLEPTDDDLDVRNDITVTRRGGSSARAVLEEGPLSVQAPPDGIGLYDEDTEVNIASDDDLDGLAWWRLHLATADEMRYPTVTLNLRNPRMSQFVQDYLDRLVVGSRITIANPPPWLPPDTIDLIVQSYEERISAVEWTVTLTCTPASRWTVATVAAADPAADGAACRVDTAGSELAAGVDEDDTTLTVAVTAVDGQPWTTTASDLPLDIRVGGEVMTVTAITGATSPQTFTVVRSVNAVTKPHAAGADVQLAVPAYVSL